MGPLQSMTVVPPNPVQPRRQGLVFVDFDKTLMEGDSHFRLIGQFSHIMNLRNLLDLENAPTRLLKSVLMTWQYQRHQLDPTTAADAVATLLEDLPILRVGRLWADAPATRNNVKRGVLEKVHEIAQDIVAKERGITIEKNGDGKRVIPDDLRQEACRRIYVVSSQFTPVLQMLTRVGNLNEDLLLGILPEHILGSDGNFIGEEGRFLKDDAFYYNFFVNKVAKLNRILQGEGIEIDPATSVAMSDDHFYDGPLLGLVDGGNRYVIDGDRGDAVYVQKNRSHSFHDRWDGQRHGHWEKVGTKWRFVIDEEHNFHFDNRYNDTPADASYRILFGALDMVPATVIEVATHFGDPTDWHLSHLASSLIPIGASTVYGLLNRTPLAHAVVGALTVGGMASYHPGGFLLPAIVGALGYAGSHFAVNNLHFRTSALKRGSKGFTSTVRWLNQGIRLVLSTALNGAMRLFI